MATWTTFSVQICSPETALIDYQDSTGYATVVARDEIEARVSISFRTPQEGVDWLLDAAVGMSTVVQSRVRELAEEADRAAATRAAFAARTTPATEAPAEMRATSI